MASISGPARGRVCFLALHVGASAVALLATAPLHAQDASVADAPGAAGLGDIIVTASKRETDVQKTPLAITAITAKALEQTHVVDAVDLNGLVPSLVITTSEGFERNVAIRGIGFNVPQNDSAQPSVSYHVDGVYIANPVALNTGFLDVSHVEVVRGPQGTVYGQNSTGGTLNVVTNLPKLGQFTGAGKLDLGNYNLVQTENAVNVPVGDSFAVRAAFEAVHHDGFAEATSVRYANGDKRAYGLSNEDSLHGRITALWKPTDRFSLMLRAEYAAADNHNSEGKNILDPEPDPWKQSSDWPGVIHYKNQIYQGQATYDFGFATLKALGSYQIVRQNGSINEDGMDLALATQLLSVPGYDAVHNIEYLYHKSKAHTGEIDLASPAGQRLEWIVGGFYLSSKYDVGYDQYSVNSYPVPGVPTSLPNQIFDNLTNPGQLGIGGDYFPYFYSLSHLTRESYSFYGQSTFHVTDGLRLTGGLRWTHDHNSTLICDYVCGEPEFVHKTETALTGKAGIEFDVARKTMLYASFSTGFKPGGGNISPAPIRLGFQFGSEKIRAYEAGLKTTFLDDRVRLNLAGFYYDYKDLQFEAEDAVAYQGGVANIPKAKVYGFEAEGSVLLPANLRFDGSLTVEDSKIQSHYQALDNVRGYYADKLVLAQYGTVFSPAGHDADIAARNPLYTDVYGNRVPNLPKFTAQGTLSHRLTFANGGVLTSSINGQYRGSYINSVFGNITQTINGKTYHVYKSPSYSLWNLYFGYQFPNQHVELSFVVKNLANNDAVLGQFTNQFGGETTRQYANPRQFIGSVAYRF